MKTFLRRVLIYLGVRIAVLLIAFDAAVTSGRTPATPASTVQH